MAEPLEVGALAGQRRADRVAVGVRVAEQRDLAGAPPDQFSRRRFSLSAESIIFVAVSMVLD
ncbi:MAG: hypothetical protein ACLR8Y_08010 [Alistipes indistinctus]